MAAVVGFPTLQWPAASKPGQAQQAKASKDSVRPPGAFAVRSSPIWQKLVGLFIWWPRVRALPYLAFALQSENSWVYTHFVFPLIGMPGQAQQAKASRTPCGVQAPLRHASDLETA